MKINGFLKRIGINIILYLENHFQEVSALGLLVQDELLAGIIQQDHADRKLAQCRPVSLISLHFVYASLYTNKVFKFGAIFIKLGQ